MIKPSIGRVVLFTPATGDAVARRGEQPLAALVTCVWSDTCVNLAVFDADGHHHARTSVYLIQDDAAKPAGFYCEWMPYQKAVAKGEIPPAVHATPPDSQPAATPDQAPAT